MFQLGDFDNVDIFGRSVDSEHFVRVEEVDGEGDFVLEVEFSGRGEVFVYLREEVKIFFDSGNQKVGGVFGDFDIDDVGDAVVEFGIFLIVHSDVKFS